MTILRFARNVHIAIAAAAETAGLYAMFILGDEKVTILAGIVLVIALFGVIAAFIAEELGV